MNIDTSQGVPVGQLSNATKRRRPYGYWQAKLVELFQLVENGEAQPNVLYRLGQFDNRAGSYNVVRRFHQNPESIPTEVTYPIRLEYRYVDWESPTGDTIKGSEVWGAIVTT